MSLFMHLVCFRDVKQIEMVPGFLPDCITSQPSFSAMTLSFTL